MYYTFFLTVLFLVNGFQCEDVPNTSGNERNIEGLVLKPIPDLPKINDDGSTNDIGVRTFGKLPFGTIGASVPMSFTSGRHGRRQIIRPGRNKNMERENIRRHHHHHHHHRKIPRRDESSSYEPYEDKDSDEGSREFDRYPSQGPIQQEQNEVPVPQEYRYKIPYFIQGNGGFGNGGQGFGSNQGGQSQNNGQGYGPNQGQGQNSGQSYGPNQGGQNQNNGQGYGPNQRQGQNNGQGYGPNQGQNSAQGYGHNQGQGQNIGQGYQGGQGQYNGPGFGPNQGQGPNNGQWAQNNNRQNRILPEIAKPVSPATQQPATEPPATQQPATEPPATQQPATKPPATEPPATQQPATEPPATKPPATQQPATEPPATQDDQKQEKPEMVIYDIEIWMPEIVFPDNSPFSF